MLQLFDFLILARIYFLVESNYNANTKRKKNSQLIRVKMRCQHRTAVIIAITGSLEHRLCAFEKDNLPFSLNSFSVLIQSEKRVENAELHKISVLAELLLLEIRVEGSTANAEDTAVRHSDRMHDTI